MLSQLVPTSREEINKILEISLQLETSTSFWIVATFLNATSPEKKLEGGEGKKKKNCALFVPEKYALFLLDRVCVTM